MAGALVFGGCGPSGKEKVNSKPVVKDAAPPAVAAGHIQFDCEPHDAQVVVDEVPRGRASEIVEKGGLKIPRGLHRIVVTRENFRPFRFELILGEKTEKITVRLKPVVKK